MSQAAKTKRTRRKPDEALARLAQVAADRGLMLLTDQWQGAHRDYRFRCAAGHEFTRRTAVAMRGTVSPPIVALAA